VTCATRIAGVLFDMDDNITGLGKRRDKTHCIKNGMMQSLLTARVRLVTPSHTLLQGAHTNCWT
jgi:hypothetical protein